MEKIYLQVKLVSDHPEIKNGEWTSTGRHDGYDMESEDGKQALRSDVAYYERQNNFVWRLMKMVEVPSKTTLEVGMDAKILNARLYN